MDSRAARYAARPVTPAPVPASMRIPAASPAKRSVPGCFLDCGRRRVGIVEDAALEIPAVLGCVFARDLDLFGLPVQALDDRDFRLDAVLLDDPRFPDYHHAV